MKQSFKFQKLSAVSCTIKYLILLCTVNHIGCSLDIPNPVYSEYNGKYNLSVKWVDKLDSLSVFTPYTIRYSSNGTDTFASYKFKTFPDGVLDSTLFYKAITDSIMTAYFIAPYTGLLKISGVQPNGKTIDTALSIKVDVPFKLKGTTSVNAGESISLTIDGTITSNDLQAQWYIDSTSTYKNNASVPFIIKSDTITYKSVYAVIEDSHGHSIATDIVTVHFNPRMPRVSFTQESIEIPVGIESTILINATDCESIRWVVKQLKITDTTTGPLKLTFTSELTDTIIATGVNRFGIESNPATLIVRPVIFNYTLKPFQGQFPDTIRARHWTDWRVSVYKNDSPISGPNITYEWETTPDKIWDTLNTSYEGDLLRFYVHDSIPSFLLSVRGRIGSDSTYLLQKPIVVRAFKPTCSFDTTDFKAQINQDISLSIKAEDSNSDGDIVDIYYTTSENPKPVSTNGQNRWNVRFLTPGIKTISAFVIDNERFISETVFAKATIVATKAYFVTPVVDTTIFIYDMTRFNAQAKPGIPGDSIVSYLWDLNNDSIWDKTTTKSFIDTSFEKTGDYRLRISCISNQGDTAQTPAIIDIHVDSGTPVIRSVSLVATSIYAGKNAALRVVASDENGSIRKLAVKINGSSDTNFVLRGAPFIDTTLSFSFTDSGKYLFSVAAIDDDSQKSAYVNASDSLSVLKGNPVVKSIKPDTAWYKTDMTLVISAEDNGSIAGYAVSYDGSEYGSWSADSTLHHTFNDSGNQYIYLKVKDNDSNTSVVLTDSVYVKAGYPIVTGLTFSMKPDSLFILDSNIFTITAFDPNKTVRKIYVNWNDGAIAHDSADVDGVSVTAKFSHIFAIADSGARNLKIWCRDDDGLLSNVTTKLVQVRVGRPVVSGISKNNATVYIKDLVSYTINASDNNGEVLSWHVSWNTGEMFKPYGSNRIDTSFGTAGNRSVRAYVVDNDGVVSDTITWDLTVQLGAPTIDSIKVVNISGNNLFVKDTCKWRVSVSDVNGKVKKIYAIWNGGLTPDDSIAVTISGSGYGEISHAYDTTLYGDRTVKFLVADEDSEMSTIKDTTIFVRKGAPVIYADGVTQDTIWVVIDSGVGRTYPVRINHSDTNGTIVNYFWNEAGATLGRSTVTDTVHRNFSQGDILVPVQMWIYGRDDDGLTRGGRFFVYADSVPPAPVVYAITGTDSITIYWKGKDRKDGDLSQYMVLLHQGGEPDSALQSDILSGFKSGYAVSDNSGYDFMYRFKISENSPTFIYNYQVWTRDARGSVTKDSGNHSFPY